MKHLDSSNHNFKGCSFKNQNLSGADFSKADIRSCDFSGAILEGANFQRALSGLSRQQEITLTITAIILAFIAGFVAAMAAGVFFIAFQKSLGQTTLLTVLILAPILALSTKRYGYIALASSLAVAIAIAGAGIGAMIGANMGALTVALFLIVGGIGAATGAGIYATIGNSSVWIAGIGSLLASVGIGVWMNNPLAAVIAMVSAGTVEVLAGFVAHSAFMGNERLDFVRQRALAFTTWGGTSFYQANLTNADFSFVKIAKTDFRKAILTRTNFKGAIDIQYCRFEDTVLYYPTIREISVTRDGQGQNFDGLSIRGVNWNDANLSDASFIGTDLSEADLRGANLTRAKLVQSQLDQTNLIYAILTGAYIENWGITAQTKLDNVECKYVFMRLPTKDNPDPYRKPDNRQEEFQPGDFADFIKPIVETLDLYHNGDIDPRAVAISFKQLAENHPQAEIEIVAMEKRGLDNFLLRAKTSSNADRSELSAEYFSNYNQLKNLTDTEIQLLLAEKDSQIRRFETMINTWLQRPSLYAENYHNQGDTIMSQNPKKVSNYNFKNPQFAGGLVDAETVHSQQIGGNINNYTQEQQQNLVEAAKEIQELLQQLEQSYPTNTPLEKQMVVTEALKQIESNEPLKARVIGALKAGGTEALKELVDHPLVNILLAALEGWQEPK
ncbi:pentapeptide repeat-containing protein [Microcoleus sp. ARI1-B5]|uniref:pentapeptide repeat-containing protein n=1 Tax=unclassified Microcoleus TaxID=2642155 RepID=UPI002FCF4EBD